jgi:hypothetical protein
MNTIKGLLAAVSLVFFAGCAATPCDSYCDKQAECSSVIDADTCKSAYNNTAGASTAVQDACQAALDILNDGTACGDAS